MTKVCKKCNLELSLDNFYKVYRDEDILHNTCKKCQKEWESEHKDQRLETGRKRDAKYIEINKLKLASDELFIGEKNCPKCNKIKSKTEFFVGLSKKDGLNSNCKECCKIKANNRKDKNKEYKKQYYIKNKEKVSIDGKERYKNNKDKILKKNKIWRQNNKEKDAKSKKLYGQKHREKFNELARLRNKNNPEPYRKRTREWARKQRKTNPRYILANRLRKHLKFIIDFNNITKFDSTENILGCSFDYFKEYIEKQFTEGMTWELLMEGKIQIDHRVPLCSKNLTLHQNIREICHYTNLRPLWEFDNLAKASKDREISIFNPKNPHILRHNFDFSI